MNLEKIKAIVSADYSDRLVIQTNSIVLSQINNTRKTVQSVEAPQVLLLISEENLKSLEVAWDRVFDPIKDDAQNAVGIVGTAIAMLVIVAPVGNDLIFIGVTHDTEVKSVAILRPTS